MTAVETVANFTVPFPFPIRQYLHECNFFFKSKVMFVFPLNKLDKPTTFNL